MRSAYYNQAILELRGDRIMKHGSREFLLMWKKTS
jgi:hypothetical protein